MRPWKIVKHPEYGAIIIPRTELLCPFCNTPLLLHEFAVYYQTSQNFYHADVKMKCPRCGFFCIFGVPISEREFRELRESKLHIKTITKEAPEIAESQGHFDEKILEEIKKRLESWGYW